MFKKICIIGCGLIGSSLARAIKKNNLAEKIVSSNRSDALNKKVIELKIVDDSSSDTKKMVDGSDLVVIATPLSSYEDVISKIKNSFKKAKEKDVKLLETFWKKIGSKVDIMDAKQHDYILSITSHIPHLIAYNIVNTSIKIQDEKESSIVKYSAGGLRDFTRIAASNPIMWRDVFIQNKKNTSEMIDKFIENLEGLKKAIENEDGKKLEKIFTKTKKIRKEIIEAGQDVSKPDFGRK